MTFAAYGSFESHFELDVIRDGGGRSADVPPRSDPKRSHPLLQLTADRGGAGPSSWHEVTVGGWLQWHWQSLLTV